MYSRESTIVFGESGESYTYEVYDVEDDFPERVGNYIFVRDDSDTWTPLYAGETGDLDDRLTSTNDPKHLMAIEEYDATHILINANSKKKSERLDEEDDIVAKYNPPCND